MAKKKKKLLSSDKIVGLTAMLISLITLIIFVRQTNIMDEQSRMSVMPYMLIELSDKSGQHRIELSLVNHGVGPAIIEKVNLQYRGRQYTSDFHTFFKEVSPAIDSLEFLNHSSIYKGLAIPSGGSINAFTVGATEEEYQVFRREIARIRNDESFDMVIQYRSIYDDSWAINPKSGTPVALDR